MSVPRTRLWQASPSVIRYRRWTANGDTESVAIINTGGSSLPGGGVAGEYLKKQSADAGDAGWSNVIDAGTFE